MEYIIENVTDEEINILEREGFEWHPDNMGNKDVVIEGDRAYYEMALHTIRRI